MIELASNIYPNWIPKKDSSVWVIDRDLTLIKKWVDRFDKENNILFLRTIENPKKWNNGCMAYSASLLGNIIHNTYQDARECIQMEAYKFEEKE